jgi:hypothetical protein
VVRGISIERFRGLAQAHLQDFRALNVFVGPNASGKSAVLEALFIAALESPAAPLVLNRLASKSDPFRWWFYRGQAGDGFKIDLEIEPSENHDSVIRFWCRSGLRSENVVIELHGPRGHHEQEYSLAQLKEHAATWPASNVRTPVRFVDVRHERLPLPILYTEATRAGLREYVANLVRSLLPGATGLEILTSADGEPELNVSFPDSAIPVALMGDGVISLVRQCLELAALPGGIVMMEEPEAFKHPASIRKVASAIVQASHRQTQVFLTTHSLELLDALLEFVGPAHLSDLAVYRMRLDDGSLQVSRFSGQQAQELRSAIEEDLR